jgi:pimeloyl-ACP methyl ester carboxylesterase
VLFFHGSPGSRMQARRLEAAATARGARLIALDRPGCGQTSPASGDWTEQVVTDARLTLDHLGVPTAPALAVSGGVAAALITASTLAERLDRLVIASGLGLVNHPELLDGASLPNKILAMVARRGPSAAQVALAPTYSISRLLPIRSLPVGDRPPS